MGDIAFIGKYPGQLQELRSVSVHAPGLKVQVDELHSSRGYLRGDGTQLLQLRRISFYALKGCGFQPRRTRAKSNRLLAAEGEAANSWRW
jgi:hypothetical protein